MAVISLLISGGGATASKFIWQAYWTLGILQQLTQLKQSVNGSQFSHVSQFISVFYPTRSLLLTLSSCLTCVSP
jgi:hypothetical protein